MYSYTSSLQSLCVQQHQSLTMFLCRILPSVFTSASKLSSAAEPSPPFSVSFFIALRHSFLTATTSLLLNTALYTFPDAPLPMTLSSSRQSRISYSLNESLWNDVNIHFERSALSFDLLKLRYRQ
uniref:HSL1 n=1 Tax=Arundo donax TaxID=35708 RepID=A0A0A9CJY8_ARUDO